MMILQSKPQQHCPAGIWMGRFISAKVPNQRRATLPCDEQVQLNMLVDTDNGEFLVYNVFCANLQEGTQLVKMLRQGLGEKYDELLDQFGQLDMAKLVGMKFRVQVTSQWKPPHKGPLILFVQLYPVEE